MAEPPPETPDGQEKPAEAACRSRRAAGAERAEAEAAPEPPPAEQAAEKAPSRPPPRPRPASACRCRTWFWIVLAHRRRASLASIYWLWNWERLEVFKMLLTSFFPLALLILAVLGSIVFGLATPAEAAAVGAFGGFMLAVAYRFIAHWRETPGRPGAPSIGRDRRGSSAASSRTRRSSPPRRARWCAGCSSAPAIFSAAFALLGGQEVIEKWVLSMDLTPLQFMILAQFIIFILGWPLEWTEIIVIFMPIFIPLLPHFNIDPLFFGLLVALNLQTAFLSPPVAMAAFYLKGVSPPHVTLNQIFAGMMPFMGIQVIALVLLYIVPGHRALAAAGPLQMRLLRRA